MVRRQPHIRSTSKIISSIFSSIRVTQLIIRIKFSIFSSRDPDSKFGIYDYILQSFQSHIKNISIQSLKALVYIRSVSSRTIRLTQSIQVIVPFRTSRTPSKSKFGATKSSTSKRTFNFTLLSERFII